MHGSFPTWCHWYILAKALSVSFQCLAWFLLYNTLTLSSILPTTRLCPFLLSSPLRNLSNRFLHYFVKHPKCYLFLPHFPPALSPHPFSIIPLTHFMSPVFYQPPSLRSFFTTHGPFLAYWLLQVFQLKHTSLKIQHQYLHINENMNVCFQALAISLSLFSSSIHLPAELMIPCFFTNDKMALCIITIFTLPICQLMNILAFSISQLLRSEWQ